MKGYSVTIKYDHPYPREFKFIARGSSPSVCIGKTFRKFRKEDGKGLRIKRFVVEVIDLGNYFTN